MKKTAEAVFNDLSYLFSHISSLNKKTVALATVFLLFVILLFRQSRRA